MKAWNFIFKRIYAYFIDFNTENEFAMWFRCLACRNCCGKSTLQSHIDNNQYQRMRTNRVHMEIMVCWKFACDCTLSTVHWMYPFFSLPFSLSISLLIVLWHNLILFLLSCYYLLLTLPSPWLWLLNCILEIISIFYAYTIVCKRNFRKCFADGDFVWLLCRWIAIWISPDLLFIVQHFYYLMPNGISALFVLNAFCPNHASAYFHLSYWNYR